jgi:hypothetical protein
LCRAWDGRWIFYFYVPLGVTALAVVTLTLGLPATPRGRRGECDPSMATETKIEAGPALLRTNSQLLSLSAL